jgi:hypothetical protein
MPSVVDGKELISALATSNNMKIYLGLLEGFSPGETRRDLDRN